MEVVIGVLLVGGRVGAFGVGMGVGRERELRHPFARSSYLVENTYVLRNLVRTIGLNVSLKICNFWVKSFYVFLNFL